MKNPIFGLGMAVILILVPSACSGGIFAASTPTPTPTHTPTITPSPVPTELPTATPLPPTRLEQNSDGTWTFYDYEVGYQFDMAETWYLEDVSALTLNQIIGRSNLLKDELEINNVPQFFIQPEGMRVLGVYLDDTLPDYLAVSFSTAHIVDEAFASMRLDEIQSRVIGVVAETYDLDPADIGSEFLVNQYDLEFGVVLYNFSLDFNQMRIFFKTADGIGMIIFGFTEENADTLGPDWAVLTSSLQHIKP